MKKLISILIILFISVGYGQNYWASEIDINFLVQSNTKVASFVDVNGIHIVYSRNGGIRYALVNSNGGIIKYDKVIESEGAGTNYASVVAFDNYVYAVYYKNNDRKVARSTNLGDNWNNSFSYYDLVNTGCNIILAYKYGDFIHIVWSEVRNGIWGYDSHYIKFTPSTPSWSDYKNVTDNETYGGDEPDITFSPDRVHVSFIKYQFSEPKTRDRSSGTWQTSESVPFHYLPFATTLRKGKPIIANNWLNEIYRANYSSFTTDGSIIGHSYRSISGSTWTENQDFLYTPIDKLNVVSNTNNNRIHIIYYDELEENYVHKYLLGTTFSNVVAIVPLFEQSSFLSSNSNDLYLLRVNNPDTPSKIKFRHYDDAPLVPTGLAITEGAYSHPQLNWDSNLEPDISNYKIWKNEGSGWYYLNQSTNNTYLDITEIYCHLPDRLCWEVVGYRTVSYRITAVDLGSNESDPSDVVNANLIDWDPNKITADPNSSKPVEYSLGQNYPNPFNPITAIDYSIKSTGLVSLKVYDMLGTEVASLVNELKEAGNYSVNFNASNLPSGIYFYTLTSGNFIDTKKLVLLK